MRYILIICLLFLQFTQRATAEEASLPVKEVSHNKTACLFANDQLLHHAAEVVRSIQFNCIVYNTRDHRATEAFVSSAYGSDYIAGDLRKRNNVFPISHWIPLTRLLLFPKHYFW